MSAPAFTPGPWKFTGAVQTADGAYICDLSSPRGAAERDATGHLIASAPELYEACLALVECFIERGPFDEPLGSSEQVPSINAAERALAKARGEQP